MTAPVQQSAPAQVPDARILVVQIDSLISVAERLTWTDDTEEARLARGAIDHARKVSAPFRYNGAARAPVQQLPIGIVATYNRGGTGERNGIEPIGKAHCSLAEELKAGTLIYAAPVQHAAPSAPTDDMDLHQLAEIFLYSAQLGAPLTISAKSCGLLFDAMTTPAAAPAEPAGLSEMPEATLWMTSESSYRLKQGGNCKGAVPVHGKPSSTAKIPLFTEDQMRAALAQPATQDKLDAERYRWLCADIEDGEERLQRNFLLERMAVMSYFAASRDIDAARLAAKAGAA